MLRKQSLRKWRQVCDILVQIISEHNNEGVTNAPHLA